ncbi:MAG: phosphoribosyl-ATP diphosphatase [Treponema sp.]|nr:phosphoribosyl-ATP diphosphatase [Treponema sp.]
MVVASIDLQGGRAVQLRQGEDLVLQREDVSSLIKDFDRYGEVALIDLDAAKGEGSNLELIKELLPRASCRVGGGIRSPETAKELVSLGAKKIIIGSMAFRDPGKPGAFALNRPFLQALKEAIGRERLIVAVDARGSDILVDGWRTSTGLDLSSTAAALGDWAGELLYTCVEREGTMGGIDMEMVQQLRRAVPQKLTVAGGVSTLEEVKAIAALGCDVQLGMALYTGKLSLEETFIESLNWGKGQDSLLPLIAQSPDGQVLMMGYGDRESLRESFKRGKLCFHSRSRGKLWMKGEESGNTLGLRRLRADCDRDTLLATVVAQGPVCHSGEYSCFETNRRFSWEYLQEIIADRFAKAPPGSYTATLDDTLVREKLMEEAEELCTALSHGDKVWEAADVLYFTTALITRAGLDVTEVLRELERRHLR